jgi:glucose uptake protein
LHANASHIGWAIVGGVIFNVANLLLVAAIEITGLAVAFPVGIGIALVVGAISSYLISPKGNALLAAIICDAAAYREREREKPAMSRRGAVISVISGVLMGSFYPFVAKAMAGSDAPGPYAVMRKPLDGKEPVALRGYADAPWRWHVWGVVGGVIWCTGGVLNFVASRAHLVGPAVSYSIGQGAHDDLCCLGRVRVARVFRCAAASAPVSVLDVCTVPAGLVAVARPPIFITCSHVQ